MALAAAFATDVSAAVSSFPISPIQQYSYTTGKNATDSAMIIDAMDILYSNTVDGFCIASSDSDFTRLVAISCLSFQFL